MFSQARRTLQYSPVQILRRHFSKKRKRPPTFVTPAAVGKDILLFEYQSPSIPALATFVGICGSIFWSYMAWEALFGYIPTPMDAARIVMKKNEQKEGEQPAKQGSWRFALACATIGASVAYICWLFPRRLVTNLSLLKGGENLQVTTYNSVWTRTFTVPVRNVFALQSRESLHGRNSYLPIKVEGTKMFFVLDMGGKFHDPDLFDEMLAEN
eukprot:comp5679_c0_seq1/m.1560 comp5679_c0_seq1/g.1560  ORF comp5679_c0_seq1/g.1560 comp5679_c0_seq1/m.1560 type:complete len:212 (-) comp5679_c0_seq1:143-778(-)